MKKFKYFIFFLLGMTILSSCFKEDTELELNDKGPNVAGFLNVRENVAYIADGSEHSFDLKMLIAGPTVLDVEGDVTVTYAATAASTAVEGLHYRFNNTSVTLENANNYLGITSVTWLSDGIVAPLDGPAPVLYLQATTTTGDASVVASGKPVQITLNYNCNSVLAGTYSETLNYSRGGVFVNTYTRTVVITETGVGEYRTSEVGHWTGGLGIGTPGFTFYDNCNDIVIPGQNLVEYYGNWVVGVAGASFVDPLTGNIYMEYEIEYPEGTDDRLYTTTYVKQ